MSQQTVDNFFPFDTGAGMNATVARWRSMGRVWNGAGIVPNTNSFGVVSFSGGTLVLAPGAVWVDGFYGETIGNKSLTGVTGSGQVVARADPTNNYVILIYVPNQTKPTQSPSGIYEIPLYNIVSGVIHEGRQYAEANSERKVKLRMYRNAAYPTNTLPAIDYGFDTVNYADPFWNGSHSGAVFICPYAGDYLVTAQIGFLATGAGQWVDMQLMHYSAAANAWYQQAKNGSANSAVNGNQMTAQITDVVWCNANDQFKIQHFYAGAGLQGLTGVTTAYFNIRSL